MNKLYCSLIFIGLALLVRAPTPAQVAPRPADSFVESIGVNVHWGYDNTVYNSGFSILKERLNELGVRHLRDGADAFVGGKGYVADRINGLYTDLGIRTTFITGRRQNGYPNPLTVSLVDDELQGLKESFPIDLIEAIEGPNEYDAIGNRQGETDWMQKVRDYQAAVYQQVKADPKLKNIPVIGPSFTTEKAYENIGSLDNYLDYSCVHLYTSWRNPGTGGWGANGYGSISWNFNYLAKKQSPSGKPAQSTECGYNTYLPEGRGLPEGIQAKYLPRTFAEFFRRGIYRSFRYELVDQGTGGNAEQQFGMLRNDLSRKPVFYAVRDLIGLLADPGPTFTTTDLDYTLEGDTKDVRQILLQKRDGSYYLMLWLEVEGYNGDTDTETPHDPQMITVQLPGSISAAHLYRQNADGGKMSNKPLPIENSAVALNVYDRIQVIKLSGFRTKKSEGIAPVADACVRGGTHQDQNYGRNPYLAVKDIDGSYNRQSLLRFDVSALAPEAKVSLVLTVRALGGEGVAVRPVTLRALADDSWQESEVTWNTTPSAGDPLATFEVTDADLNRELRLEVTDYVHAEREGDGTVSFVLVQPTDENAVVNFGSRESTTPPRLEGRGSSPAGRDPSPGPWYYLQNRACGNYLSATGCGDVSLARQTTAAEQWQLVADQNDYFVLRNRACPDLLLETDESEINLRAGRVADDARWKLVSAGAAWYYLEDYIQSKRIDTDGCRDLDVKSAGGTQKQWRFVVAEPMGRLATVEKKPLPSKVRSTPALRVHPNPTHDRVTVEVSSETAQTVTVVIHDASGLVVQRQSASIGVGVQRIDAKVSQLPPGLYLLRVSSPHNHYPDRKLIIQ